MGRVTESLAYRVKNTFVEIGRGSAHVVEEDPPCDHVRGCLPLPCSDESDIKAPPAPYCTTQETTCALGKSSLTWVPDTPSPFLHPANFLGHSGVVPHMGLGSAETTAFGEDMALPPAFGDVDAQFGMAMAQGFDGQGMDGYYGLPTMMYDQASGATYGWCMPMDGLAQGGTGGAGETDDGTDQAMLEGQGVGFDPLKQDEHPQGPGWCQDGSMLMDQQGCSLKEGLVDGQCWGTDGGMPMEPSAGMMDAAGPAACQMAEQDLTTQHILEALGSPQVVLQDGHQVWGLESGMQLDCHDPQGCQMGDEILGGALMEMLPDGQVWNPEGGMLLDQEQSMQQVGLAEGQWCTDGGMAIEQDCSSFKDSQCDAEAWGPDGQESRSGVAWRGKSSRGGRGRHAATAHEDPVTPSRDGSGGETSLLPNGSGFEARGDEIQTASGGELAAGGCTTVMLRNIPNKYTREMLVKQLTQDFRGRFDFVYLPIDFKNSCNVGYGFINFRTPDACEEFVTKFNGVDVRKCLPGLNSRKVCEVTPARVQGLDENVRRLRNGPVMNELVHHPAWMPLLLDGDGEEKMFPLPDQPCPPVKPRRRAGREDSHGGGNSGGDSRGGGSSMPNGGGRRW